MKSQQQQQRNVTKMTESTQNCQLKKTSDFFDNAYSDSSADVKHASTPMDRTIHHSPQLPVPSPNLPIDKPKDCHKSASLVTSQQTLPPISNIDNTPTSQTINNGRLSKDAINQEGAAKKYLGGKLQQILKVPKCETKDKWETKEEIPQMAAASVRDDNMSETGSSFTVLNIPNLTFQPPPVKRQKLSKIDVATFRRRLRRGRRKPDIDDSTSSASSDDEAEQQVDLWIRSGPPCKLDLKPEKVRFLEIFGLTTYSKRNCELVTLV